jgi:hypothetical protein
MRMLYIVQCPDHLMWYRRKVGCMVELLRNLPAEECWLSREPSGLTNIVRHVDAVAVPEGWVHVSDRTTLIDQCDRYLRHRLWVPVAFADWATEVGQRVVIRFQG